MNQELFLGFDSSLRLVEILNKIQPSKVLLLRGQYSYAISGAQKYINQVLNERKIAYVEFFDFELNPKEKDLKRGLKIISEEQIEFIISIGGGSVLDMAKLIRFYYSFKENADGTYTQKNDLLPLVAIPTTAGTGSEATHFAVLYKGNQKYSIAHTKMLPDIAIVDPEFTISTSSYITATTGFDALSQAIESYWNINANEESEEYAKRAIELIYHNLPMAVQDGQNRELRLKIAEGAYLAGKAINITRTTAPHAFSYPFTTYYNYSHGHAVAMTFPFFLQFNYNLIEEKLSPRLDINQYSKKMSYLYSLLNITSRGEAMLSMKKYIEKLGLSLKLPDNFDPQLIINNVNIERLENTPIMLNEQDILNVLKNFN